MAISMGMAGAALELASAAAQQTFSVAMLRKSLDAEKDQATYLLNTFDDVNRKLNENINTEMTRSVKPYLGVRIDLYI